MISFEVELAKLNQRELIELLNRVLESRDDVAEHRRLGLRLARFAYYKGESIITDLIGVADWRDICEQDREEFEAHFAEELVQCGTCDNCQLEIVSYSKSAKCPACFDRVQCT